MAGSLPWPAEPLSARTSCVTVVVALALLFALLGVGAWAVVRPSSAVASAHGCITVVVALATGGDTLRDCGPAAHTICATEFGRSDRFARLVQPQCRLAGIEP